MALADYYLCDECGAKTFYDARLSYDDDNANPDTAHPWPDNVGWMRVLCLDCAEASRSESEDTQAKPDWNPNEGVICDGSTNHIEFQPTPTQADVDALVKAAGFAANRLAVICESAKHDMTTKEKSALSALNAALTPFQKG